MTCQIFMALLCLLGLKLLISFSTYACFPTGTTVRFLIQGVHSCMGRTFWPWNRIQIPKIVEEVAV